MPSYDDQDFLVSWLAERDISKRTTELGKACAQKTDKVKPKGTIRPVNNTDNNSVCTGFNLCLRCLGARRK